MNKPWIEGRKYRIFSFVFGLVLLGVGVFALFFAVVDGWLRYLAALGFIAAGANLMWAARKGRESWLSKIGPLP